MTSHQRVCPNGHPLVRPGMTFCETCGAPIGAPVGAPPPVVGFAPASAIVAGSRSNTPLILGLAAIAIIVVAAGSYLVLAPKATTTGWPYGSGAQSTLRMLGIGQSPSAAPSGAHSAAPDATSSPEVTAPPDVTPAPVVTPVAGKTCHSAKFGVTVTYPTAWYEYTGDPDRTCTLFDPKPFPTITDGSDPQGIIEFFSEANPMAKVVADYQGAAKVLQTTPTTIDGRPATLLEIDYTGVGAAPNGLHEYLYLIDMGQTTLAVAAQGIYDPSAATADWPYDGYKDNVKVVDSIARTLKFD
jgi:hypothetical protein